MQIIGCPVQWIDDPAEFTVSLFAAFFGQYTVIRVGFQNGIDNNIFGMSVHFRYKIVPSLAVNGNVLNMVDITYYLIARGAGCTYTDIKHWVHPGLRRFMYELWSYSFNNEFNRPGT